MRTLTSSRFKRAALLIVAAVLVVFIAAVAYAQFRTPPTLAERAFSAAVLEGDYLVRHTNDDGSYNYRYDPETNRVLSGYNMLRHAGTTYALLELYGATGKKSYLEAAERALGYLRAAMAPCPKPRSELQCVYDGTKAKLGGNALAMLAFVEHRRVTNSTEYLSDAETLAHWARDTMSVEGEFTVHIQYKDGSLDGHISQYYPGEAIFALARLSKVTGEDMWFEAAADAAQWLITVRDNGKTAMTVSHDHWLLYGLRELYAREPHPEYVEHAKKIVDGIQALQHKTNDVPVGWIGGFYEPPRSAPTATRGEGLAAAYHFLLAAQEYAYAEKALEAIELATAFQLSLLIDKQKARTYPVPSRAQGGMPESTEEMVVRIDYVQHSISALLAYHAIASVEKER